MPLFKTPPPSTSRVLLEVEDEGGGDVSLGPRRGQRLRKQKVLFSPPSASQKGRKSGSQSNVTPAAVRRSPRLQLRMTAADAFSPPSPQSNPALNVAPLPPPLPPLVINSSPTHPLGIPPVAAHPPPLPPDNASQQGSQPVLLATPPFPVPASLPTLEEAHLTHIPTHRWTPKSVRPELTRVTTALWNHLAEHPQDEGAWIMQSILPRCILPATKGPNLGDPRSHAILIKERLRRWQAGECGDLWQEAKDAREQQMRAKKGKSKEEKSQQDRNVQRAIVLASEGQYSRAIEALTSLGLAQCNEATLAEMKQKHPAPLGPTKIPTTDVSPRTFSPTEVRKAVESFKRGAAAGPSGLRPEHLQTTIKVSPGNRGEKAATALTKLVNILAKGSLPARVAPYFCGAKLHAAKKKDNGLRPIAVGDLLCRLVAKCFASAVGAKVSALLAPHQLGVAVRNGCEAVTHAVREVVDADPSSWVLQCDLVNAFNVVDRSHMLEAVAQHIPECLAWANTCYGMPSAVLPTLQTGSFL